MDTSLTNKTALITGGSLGLGLAMAKHFYSAGANVAILARRPEPLIEAAAEIAEQDGDGNVAYFACDVTDPTAVIATHNAVAERFGPVDILVNNAGQSAAKPFSQITDEEWQADLDLKLEPDFSGKKLKEKMFYIEGYCTMINSIEMLSLYRTTKTGRKYKKYPKLIELYQHLFKGEDFNAHNALDDVRACFRCYKEMCLKQGRAQE